MKLSYKKFDLPLRHVFTISRGSVSVQQTLIVQLEADGKYGYGEATTNTFYGATIENMSATIESVQQMIESSTLGDPLELIAKLAKSVPHEKYANFALNALDLAIHDLWGKLRGAPVYKLWGLSIDKIPDSDYTLGIDTPAKMVAKMEEMPGWPVYKIKLGTSDDLTIVRELRKHTDALFRVDANCGWTAEQTIEFAPILKDMNVEFIEQPLPPEDVEGARRAFKGSVLPLLADENCIVESDVDRCAGAFHGINIKLTKCGGLATARRMAKRARELGLQVMAGCMTESTVGISAIA
ncbi:MAG TPA: dipeptide epimerase, partial [Lacipirellulaceae bacterium]|nr:dipeptide epimerase [Lacipirellulaceae bacterium]